MNAFKRGLLRAASAFEHGFVGALSVVAVGAIIARGDWTSAKAVLAGAVGVGVTSLIGYVQGLSIAGTSVSERLGAAFEHGFVGSLSAAALGTAIAHGQWASAKGILSAAAAVAVTTVIAFLQGLGTPTGPVPPLQTPFPLPPASTGPVSPPSGPIVSPLPPPAAQAPAGLTGSATAQTVVAPLQTSVAGPSTIVVPTPMGSGPVVEGSLTVTGT